MNASIGPVKYGMPSLAPATATLPVAQGASNGAVTTGAATRRFLDPESPELWLVGLGAVMLGLIAVSTSVRVGPVRLAASAGK
jgi:hypothetical protein